MYYSNEGIGQTVVDAMKKLGNMIFEFLKKLWKFFGDFFKKNEPDAVKAQLAASLNCSVKELDKQDDLYKKYVAPTKIPFGYNKDGMIHYINQCVDAITQLEKALNAEGDSSIPSIQPPEKKENSTIAQLGYKSLKDIVDVSEAITAAETKIKPICTKVDTKLKECVNTLKNTTTGSEQDTTKAAQTKSKNIMDQIQGIGKQFSQINQYYQLTIGGIITTIKNMNKQNNAKAPTQQSAAQSAAKNE